MRRKNILKVLAALKDKSLRPKRFKFNMGTFADFETTPVKNNLCGTAGCLAGLTVALLDPEMWNRFINRAYKGHYTDNGDIAERAQKLLGISDIDANRLFHPWAIQGNWSDIRPSTAARVLDRFLKTGEVNWA